MTRHDVKKNVTRRVKLSWNKALADARLRLARAKDDVRNLELAVQTFEEKVKNGEPWPGEQSATQN